MPTTVLDRPPTLDAPPRSRRNDRPSERPDPIPDAAALRYAARAYRYETHSHRDTESWERIFAAEGADVRAAAMICGRLRTNPGVSSLAWLFDFIDRELERGRLLTELGAILAVARAFGEATTHRERERLGAAVSGLVEHLSVGDEPHVTGLAYELTICVWGFVHGLRTMGADHPGTESELRGVVRGLAELRAHWTERPVGEHAAAVGDELVRAFR